MYLQKKYKTKDFNFDANKINLNREIFPGKPFTFLSNFEEVEHIPSDPKMKLFYWCILSNRTEIAKIFWRLGKVNKYFD